MSLRGRLALVTGGASGIGKATCHGLEVQGATAVMADLTEARKVFGTPSPSTVLVGPGDRNGEIQADSPEPCLSQLTLLRHSGLRHQPIKHGRAWQSMDGKSGHKNG
ncbi:hypothetical protein MRX96_011011 [Rhipicephalus microplus]